MSSGVLIVLADAVAGRESEFNDWYDRVHLPEILELSSFVGARRYRLNPRPEVTLSHGFLTIYEVTDTLQAARELATAVDETISKSDALDDLQILQGYYDQVTTVRQGES